MLLLLLQRRGETVESLKTTSIGAVGIDRNEERAQHFDTPEDGETEEREGEKERLRNAIDRAPKSSHVSCKM
jgi:hypothetical protein